jgi:hypothetical protein
MRGYGHDGLKITFAFVSPYKKVFYRWIIKNKFNIILMNCHFDSENMNTCTQDSKLIYLQ